MVASPSALMAWLTFACTDQSITAPIQSWIVVFRSGQVNGCYHLCVCLLRQACISLQTNTCLTYLTDHICLQMDKGFYTGMIMTDLQKAFDTESRNPAS